MMPEGKRYQTRSAGVEKNCRRDGQAKYAA
jgi:hypothetical protein